YCQRKAEAVAEAVGEEELRGGEHHVARFDAEHRYRIQLGRFDQAAVYVDGTLRSACRARGVQPEAGVVLRRRGDRRLGCETGHRGRERINAIRARAGDEPSTQMRKLRTKS